MDTFTRGDLAQAYAASIDEGHVSLEDLLIHLAPNRWSPAVGEVVFDEDNDEYVRCSKSMKNSFDVDPKGLAPISLGDTRFTPMLELIRRIATNEEILPGIGARRFIEENYKRMGFPLKMYSAEVDL